MRTSTCNAANSLKPKRSAPKSRLSREKGNGEKTQKKSEHASRSKSLGASLKKQIAG